MERTRTTRPLITDDWHIAGDVYRDPAVFEAEMDQIFGKCWVFVAHESELATGGEYKLARVGRQPVIVMRSADDGAIRVVYNRCRHRAAAVCHLERGNAKHHKCAYHGWTYNSAGSLVAVPFPDAYGDDFDKDALGLVEVPRVANYRGFIFASLDPDVPEIVEYLGNARPYLDNVADAGIDLTAGAHKVVYDGNWKLQVENTIDPYHLMVTHRSWVETLRRRSGNGSRSSGWDAAMADYAENLIRNPSWRNLDLGGGHGVAEWPREGSDGPSSGGVLPYIFILFPSLCFLNWQLRVVCPVAVDKTEVYLYPLMPQNSDREARSSVLRDHEVFHGPAGAGYPDDVEVAFARVTDGLRATATTEDWLLMNRGLHREERDPQSGIVIGRPTDETCQRAFYRHWLELVDGNVAADVVARDRRSAD